MYTVPRISSLLLVKLALLACFLFGNCCQAFQIVSSLVSSSPLFTAQAATSFDFLLQDIPNSLGVAPLVASSFTLAASAVDPTAFLSDLLGGLLGTPAILAIPIVAALLVASAIAFFIVSYANPAEDE